LEHLQLMSVADISNTAGVSMATVSRVLNRRPHVSRENVDAVQEAIKNAGYSRKGRHRRDAIGWHNRASSGQIAVLFPDTNQGALRTRLSGRLLHGIESALQRRGLTMAVSNLAEDGQMPLCMALGRIDGVIVRNVAPATEMHRLQPKIPAVWIFQAPFDQVNETEAGGRAGFS
jgi:DNA-binding LacI/PurR family transcriptional regulator